MSKYGDASLVRAAIKEAELHAQSFPKLPLKLDEILEFNDKVYNWAVQAARILETLAKEVPELFEIHEDLWSKYQELEQKKSRIPTWYQR